MMQEVNFDGTLGKRIEVNSLEELIPHIKESLAKKSVKHVIVTTAGVSWLAQEEKRTALEEWLEDEQTKKA